MCGVVVVLGKSVMLCARCEGGEKKRSELGADKSCCTLLLPVNLTVLPHVFEPVAVAEKALLLLRSSA